MLFLKPALRQNTSLNFEFDSLRLFLIPLCYSVARCILRCIVQWQSTVKATAARHFTLAARYCWNEWVKPGSTFINSAPLEIFARRATRQQLTKQLSDANHFFLEECPDSYKTPQSNVLQSRRLQISRIRSRSKTATIVTSCKITLPNYTSGHWFGKCPSKPKMPYINHFTWTQST